MKGRLLVKGRLLAAVAVCAVVAVCGARGAITDGLQSYWNFDRSSSDYADKVGSVHLQERIGQGANIEAVTANALILRSLYNSDTTDWTAHPMCRHGLTSLSPATT